MSSTSERRRNMAVSRRRATGATIDLTPMIDVTFQLLIFFLLTATFRDFSSLDVELAEAKNKERAQEQESVVVSIGKDGEIEIDGKLVDPDELELRLCKANEEGSSSLHIRADKQSKHEDLVRTMDIGKRCKFRSLGILHTN